MMNRKSAGITRWRRWFGVGLLCATAVLALEACVPVVLVGGGVAGTMAATDRRTIGAQTEDRTISFRGESVAASIVGNQGHVNVTSFNKLVLITGEVPNEGMKVRVASEVAQISHVKNVVNELEIAPPSTLGSRSNDSLITAKVTASFLDAKDLYVNSLKTVTERGIVYLMGRVTEREGRRAAEVASGVSGVQRVVKVFEYISEEELARLKAQLAPDSGSGSSNVYRDGEQYR